jgi:hypothetical protein
MEAIFEEGLRIYLFVDSPAEIEVGLSQWAVARNPAVWGSDVDFFRPESQQRIQTLMLQPHDYKEICSLATA